MDQPIYRGVLRRLNEVFYPRLNGLTDPRGRLEDLGGEALDSEDVRAPPAEDYPSSQIVIDAVLFETYSNRAEVLCEHTLEDSSQGLLTNITCRARRIDRDSRGLPRDIIADHPMHELQIFSVIKVIEIQLLLNLLSEVNPEDVARLVASLATLSSNVGNESASLLAKTQTLLDRLGEAAEIAPALKEDVPPLLKDLRRTVRETRVTVGKADTAIAEARALMTQLDKSTSGLPGVVADVQKAIDTIEPGLDDLKRAMEASDSAAENLAKILTNWKDFDEGDLTRVLREEGVLVRLKEPKKKKKPSEE